MEKNKINLVSVKNLGRSKFEISFRQNGNSKKIIITENRHWVEEIEDYISNITSDNPEFYEIWGCFDFRTKVCSQIKQFSKMPERASSLS